MKRHHSEESKRKMSLAHIGKKMSKQTKKKMIKMVKNLWKNPEHRKKHSEKMKRLWQNTKFRENFIKKMKEKWRDKDYKRKVSRKISLAHKNRIKKLGYMNTKETRKKISLASKDVWKNPKKHNFDVQARNKKISLAHKGMKKRWVKQTLNKMWGDNKRRNKRTKAILKGAKIKPNKPEKIMMQIIRENHFPFNYVGNGKVIMGGFNPDFLSHPPKYIIEVFGNYWHNLLNIKEKDKRRFKTYTSLGYKTLIVWEHELKEPQKVTEKIRRFLRDSKT